MKDIPRIMNSREQAWRSIGARDTTMRDVPCGTPRSWSGPKISKGSSPSTSCGTVGSDWQRAANECRRTLASPGKPDDPHSAGRQHDRLAAGFALSISQVLETIYFDCFYFS